MVKAVADFGTAEGAQDGDLQFKVGDEITVTDDADDWWQGALVSDPSKSGQFPKNFVKESDSTVATQEPAKKGRFGFGKKKK